MSNEFNEETTNGTVLNSEADTPVIVEATESVEAPANRKMSPEAQAADQIAKMDAAVQNSKSLRVHISDLTISNRVQCRDSLDAKAIKEYESVILEASGKGKNDRDKVTAMLQAMPELIAFKIVKDGKEKFVVVSGHHRLRAYKNAFEAMNFEDVIPVVRAKIIDGFNELDAAHYAAHCNSKFEGVRMKADDWKQTVKNIIANAPANARYSARAIEKMIGGKLSHVTINKIINELKGEGEAPTEAKEVITRNGSTRKDKASKPVSKKGIKQDNGDWVPDEMIGIWKDTAISEIVLALRNFQNLAASGKNTALKHVLPASLGKISALITELEDSLPSIVCPECDGTGCDNCNSSGFVPVRECHGIREEYQKALLLKQEEKAAKKSKRNEEAEEFNSEESSLSELVAS